VMVLGGSRVGPRGASEPDAIVSGHWGRAAAGWPARSVNEKAPPAAGSDSPPSQILARADHGETAIASRNTPSLTAAHVYARVAGPGGGRRVTATRTRRMWDLDSTPLPNWVVQAPRWRRYHAPQVYY